MSKRAFAQMTVIMDVDIIFTEDATRILFVANGGVRAVGFYYLFHNFAPPLVVFFLFFHVVHSTTFLVVGSCSPPLLLFLALDHHQFLN